MTTKEQIKTLLKENHDSYLSGQEIADRLFVTRACVWKNIKALEKEGLEIDAVTNKGYKLKSSRDFINYDEIQRFINDGCYSLKVHYYESIDSTNQEAMRLSKGCDDNLVVIANSQTNGRGRRGREFYSPSYTGLYFSILLHTDNLNAPLENITGITASSVAIAIDNIIFNGNDVTGIKWVNDIFINNKKVCGILSEANLCIEDMSQSYIVIGIGINVYEPDNGFPKEIKKNTTALLAKENKEKNCANLPEPDALQLRTVLCNEIIKNLFYYLNHPSESINIYRQKSVLIDNYIKINAFREIDSSRKYAHVDDITDNYHLKITYDDGVTDELSSGEVSVIKY